MNKDESQPLIEGAPIESSPDAPRLDPKAPDDPSTWITLAAEPEEP